HELVVPWREHAHGQADGVENDRKRDEREQRDEQRRARANRGLLEELGADLRDHSSPAEVRPRYVASRAAAPPSSSSSRRLAASRPRSMITARSTVWATSDRTWLDRSTVPPSSAYARRNVRNQWMPAGSRPFAGSSSTSRRGAPSSAAASPS